MYVDEMTLIFCFIFIQGQQLTSAAIGGDMAEVRRLLEEDPNLVRYKDRVKNRIA